MFTSRFGVWCRAGTIGDIKTSWQLTTSSLLCGRIVRMTWYSAVRALKVKFPSRASSFHRLCGQKVTRVNRQTKSASKCIYCNNPAVLVCSTCFMPQKNTLSVRAYVYNHCSSPGHCPRQQTSASDEKKRLPLVSYRQCHTTVNENLTSVP